MYCTDVTKDYSFTGLYNTVCMFEVIQNCFSRHIRNITSFIYCPTLYSLSLPLPCLLVSAGPMEPLTPAAVEAMSAAEDARRASTETRKEAWAMVDHSGRAQHAAHRAVNQGLTQKLAQTVTLAVSAGV